MDWNKIIVDNLAHLFVLLILGGMGFLFRSQFIAPITQVKLELNKHIDECNKIPKLLILEKINSLEKKVDLIVAKFIK